MHTYYFRCHLHVPSSWSQKIWCPNLTPMWSLFPRGRASNKEAKRDSSAWVLFSDLQAQIVEEESSNFRMKVVCYLSWDQQPRGRISSLSSTHLLFWIAVHEVVSSSFLSWILVEKYLSPGDLHKLCSSVEMGAICSWKREKKAPCIKYKVCIYSLSLFLSLSIPLPISGFYFLFFPIFVM